jgi:hypothetical protein
MNKLAKEFRLPLAAWPLALRHNAITLAADQLLNTGKTWYIAT